MTNLPGEPEEEIKRIYAIRLHQQAIRDIDAACNRLSETIGTDAAEQWEEGLFAALATLARLPKRQVIAPENRYFRREVRQLVYRRGSGLTAYRVLFTLVSDLEGEAPFVYILHVRHGTQRPITRAEARVIDETA